MGPSVVWAVKFGASSPNRSAIGGEMVCFKSSCPVKTRAKLPRLVQGRSDHTNRPGIMQPFVHFGLARVETCRKARLGRETPSRERARTQAQASRRSE